MMSHFAFLTATIAGPAFLFSGVSLSDPITLLPSVLLFALGLVFGLLISRSGRRATAGDPQDAPDAGAETLVEAPAAVPPADNKADADPEALRALRAELGEAQATVAALEGDLAASKRLSESQNGEIQLLGERFALLRQQLEEKSLRLSALTPLVGGPVTPRTVLAQVKLPVDQLAEVVHGERQLLGGCLARLEHLETRMREEDRRFRQAGEVLARTRDEVGGRLSDTAGTGPALFALADRLSQVDDQLRVLGQNISGCVSRIQSAREHLQSEQGKLREAAQPIQEAEKSLSEILLSSDESVDVAPVLDAVRSRLTEAGGHVATLENGIDQEIAEMIGRVDWTVRDSPAGFLKALDRLNDGESGGDLALSWIESRVWRDLNELRGALSGIQVTLETGAIAAPATGCGKRRLMEAADRAVRSVDAAQSLSIEAPTPDAEPLAALEEQAEDRTALEAELASVKAESADRVAEIASLRESLAGLEASLAKALSEARTGHPAIPMHADEEEETDESVAAPTPSTARPSRHLIRRLLGLGPGRWESDLDTSSAYPSAPAVVATLAEAKAIVTELRRVPVEVAGEASPAGHHGLPAAVLAPAGADADASPSEPEWDALKEALRERDWKIADLEARLREVTAPVAPVVEPATEIPGILPAESAAKALLPGAILPGDSLPDRQGETVLFSGLDPESWALPGSTDKDDIDGTAPALPADTGYLRLTRLDTGESVVGAISVEELLAGGDPKAKQGWSGRVEQYFGACHLGFFDESLPREVETRFGAGGWGFGHRADGSNGQAYAWAGRQIADFTAGFEISVGPRSRWTGVAPEMAMTETPAIEPVALGLFDESAAADEAPEQETALASGPGEAERDHLRALSDNRVSGLVLFRSNDPGLWGSEVYTGMNRRARRLDWLPEGLAYLRLRRLDTGEGLVAPVTNAQLTDDGDGQSRGFNGANEFFYGAHHLGFFDEALPQDFETRFTFGGWGFGHASTGPERQACGWAGREISEGTVFEIAVFRRMPVLAEKDRLWDEVG